MLRNRPVTLGMMMLVSGLALLASAPLSMDRAKASEPKSKNAQALEREARRFVAAFYEAMSAEPATALAFSAEAYADLVYFRGKRITRAEVLRRQETLFDHWPRRSYGPSDSDMATVCNVVAQTCRVQAIIHWRVGGNDEREPFSGVDRARLDLAFAHGRPRIVFEASETVGR